MTKNVFTSSIVFGLLTTALVIGCSSADSTDDGDSSESAYRKKPKATENWSNLTLALPTGSCQPGGSCAHPLGAVANIQLDGAAVTLAAANRIKPGDHTVTVNGVSTIVTLAAGASKTLTLPTAHRKCTAAGLPSVATTDFGKTITLANAACPSTTALSTSSGGGAKPSITLFWYNWGCPAGNVTGALSTATNAAACAALRTDRVYSVNVNGACIDLRQTRADGQYGINPVEACNAYVAGDTSWVALGSTGAQLQDYDLAFVPGKYEVVVGTGADAKTQSFTLKDGDASSEIAVSLPVVGSISAVFKTNLSFADARELPDAATATITSSCGGDRNYSVPASVTTQLKLTAFAVNTCTYTLSAGGRTTTLDQTTTNAVTLHRVDVDNVEITRENGSVYTVAGKYEIFFGGARVAGPFNTNTGVDLLGGTYELVTTFSTADGPQTQHETLTL
jgi:hypothetical protein